MLIFFFFKFRMELAIGQIEKHELAIVSAVLLYLVTVSGASGSRGDDC